MRVDVKADSLAGIVQTKQRCRGSVCGIYRFEHAGIIEEAVGDAVAIDIEANKLIVVVDRGRRRSADAIRIVDVEREKIASDGNCSPRLFEADAG